MADQVFEVTILEGILRVERNFSEVLPRIAAYLNGEWITVERAMELLGSPREDRSSSDAGEMTA